MQEQRVIGLYLISTKDYSGNGQHHQTLTLKVVLTCFTLSSSADLLVMFLIWGVWLETPMFAPSGIFSWVNSKGNSNAIRRKWWRGFEVMSAPITEACSGVKYPVVWVKEERETSRQTNTCSLHSVLKCCITSRNMWLKQIKRLGLLSDSQRCRAARIRKESFTSWTWIPIPSFSCRCIVVMKEKNVYDSVTVTLHSKSATHHPAFEWDYYGANM